MIQFRIDGLDEVRGRFQGAVQQAQIAPRRIVNRAALLLRRYLRDAVPKRSGEGEKSITFVVGQVGSSVVAQFFGAKHLSYVIHGTKAHDIWAGFYTGRSNKKALYWPGAAHPVTHVRHPGTKPNDFRQPAMRRLRSSIGLVYADEAPRILRGR